MYYFFFLPVVLAEDILRILQFLIDTKSLRQTDLTPYHFITEFRNT